MVQDKWVPPSHEIEGVAVAVATVILEIEVLGVPEPEDSG